MIHFVTGKINSGKTTRLVELYERNQLGDGFIAFKVMRGNIVERYDARQLSSQETFPYVVRDQFDTGSKPILCQIGPYRFYEAAIRHIECEIRRFIDYSIEPIYLDEIGMLEIQKQGFYTIFQEMVDSNLDCVVSARQDLIEKIVETFHIKQYRILS